MNGITRHSQDVGETWRRRLLDGVKDIPDRGLPGTVEVFGEHARPILMSTLAAPWVAAAEYGRGRVVVVAHDAYAAKFEATDQDKDLARFHLNIKLWLTRGCYRDQTQIGSLEDERLDMKNKLILVIRGRTPIAKPDKMILNFIKRGGSLLHAMCPWGWVELHDGKTVGHMPYAKVLETIGLCYQKTHWFMPKDGYKVKDYLASGVVSTRLPAKKFNTNHRVESRSMDSTIESDGTIWRTEILDGVELVPNLAAPGYVCVYGDNAHPILKEQRGEGVWMAAATVGKGRVIVMAHNAFMRYFESGHENADLSRLMSNMQKWLTRGAYQDQSDIGCLQRGVFNLKTNKILVMRGRSQFKIPDEDVIRYLKGGGALLHSFATTTWLFSHPGKTLRDIPYASVLEKAGISYMEGNWQIPASGLRVHRCMATDDHHIRLALNNITSDVSSKTLLLMTVLPGDILGRILDDCKNDILELENITTVHCTPTVETPVFSTTGRAMMGITESLAKAGRIPAKLPAIDEFPGDFEVRPNKFRVKVDIVSNLEDVYSSGCYLRAGDEVTVNVQTEEAVKTGWRMQIGCHTDRLFSLDNHLRWPNISQTVNVDRRRFTVHSMFGGLIYFLSPGKPSAIEVVLSNVVEAPFFDLTNRIRIDGWKDRRYAPGLWADICGEFICITVPSKCIRHLDDPTEVMRTWDDVVASFHHLRGSNVRKYRKQWIVTDVQPLGGSIHAGYPIVAGIELSNPISKNFLLNYTHLMDGAFWDVFSQIGKNMQKVAWTFKGTEEVTCNIFALYGFHMICGVKPWMPEWLLSRVKSVRRFLEKNEGFYEWAADSGLALFVYAQLVHQFGWGLYKRVFRKYRSMPMEDLPRDNVYKMDFWFTALSHISGYNLAPLCDFWRIPLSTDVRNWLTQFPPFLPDDEMSQLAPERVEQIISVYGDVVRHPKKQVVDDFLENREPIRFKQPDVMTHIVRS